MSPRRQLGGRGRRLKPERPPHAPGAPSLVGRGPAQPAALRAPPCALRPLPRALRPPPSAEQRQGGGQVPPGSSCHLNLRNEIIAHASIWRYQGLSEASDVFRRWDAPREPRRAGGRVACAWEWGRLPGRAPGVCSVLRGAGPGAEREGLRLPWVFASLPVFFSPCLKEAEGRQVRLAGDPEARLGAGRLPAQSGQTGVR